jgi:hypothetical protein
MRFLTRVKIRAAGEMGANELEKGGEWYDVRLKMEKIAKDAGADAVVKPFDQYQGPFAEISIHGRDVGQLWCGDGEFGQAEWTFKPTGGSPFVGNQSQIVNHIKAKVPRVIPGGKPAGSPTSGKQPQLRLVKGSKESQMRFIAKIGERYQISAKAAMDVKKMAAEYNDFPKAFLGLKPGTIIFIHKYPNLDVVMKGGDLLTRGWFRGIIDKSLMRVQCATPIKKGQHVFIGYAGGKNIIGTAYVHEVDGDDALLGSMSSHLVD